MKRRSLPKMFLLFIVTIGIYRLYWLYKTRQEMAAQGKNPPRFIWYLLIWIVIIVSALIMIVGAMVSAFNDVPTETSDAVYIISMAVFYTALILSGPLMALWYWKYSKAAEEVTNGNLQFALAMIALILIPDGFDILIIQDAFNKVDSVDISKSSSPLSSTSDTV